MLLYRDDQNVEKVKVLEHAAVNLSPDEISEVCTQLGQVKLSARALGLACRFRGVDCVRALVEGGATFDTPKNRQEEMLYHAYSIKKKDFNHSNYSVYLLNIDKKLEGSYCSKSMRFQSRVKSGKKTLSRLSDSERAEVLRYLFENRQKCLFEPAELLYYSIFAQDVFLTKELKKLGVGLSENRIKALTEGGKEVDCYWREYRAMTDSLVSEHFFEVTERLFCELGGKKFRCTEIFFEAVRDKLSDRKFAEFFFEKFNTNDLNRSKLLRDMVDRNDTALMPIVEKTGWLADINRRDMLIKYASENGRTECAAWLLDFKNRTADLSAERVKAEKKLERELNAAPDSVTALKVIWSYGKLDDGTLIIKRYKGDQTDIVVPKKIGKSIVTVIGDYAFSPNNSRTDKERQNFLKTIRRVTLPDTISRIGKGAFSECVGLTEIGLPDSVETIGAEAFEYCKALERVKLPNGLCELSDNTFYSSGIKEVYIPDSVRKIGAEVFGGCRELKGIVLPDSVEKIGANALSRCINLETARLPNGLSEIAARLFEECQKLSKINIPNSVKKIGTGAFFSCMELGEISVPDSVREIGNYAFSFCIHLERVKLPNGITEISDHLFNGCQRLRKINIPEGIKRIGNVAFCSCVALKEIIVPDGVVSIGRQAFEHCVDLKRIVLPSSIKQIPDPTISCYRQVLTILTDSLNAVAEVVPNSYAENYCKQNGIKYIYGGTKSE